MASTTTHEKKRLGVLDGWRAFSILCVLGTHLLPLGPKNLQFNHAVGPMGMAVFFTLSGFLITRSLIEHSSVGEFLVRRLFRVVPLAWLALLLVLPTAGAPAAAYLPNFLFYANLPPAHLVNGGAHLWSLSVEMQFYFGIALLVMLLGQRGLYLLPIVSLAVTAHRISAGAYVDIVTIRRVDEILAGGILALVYTGGFGNVPRVWMTKVNAYLLLVLLLVCSHPAAGFMNFLRPYAAATMVGATLFKPPARLERLLLAKTMAYIAAISFALYVTHGILMATWFGEGERLVKYAKRPLLFAAAFALSHLSTFYFERPCIGLGKRLSEALRRRREAIAASQS